MKKNDNQGENISRILKLWKKFLGKFFDKLEFSNKPPPLKLNGLKMFGVKSRKCVDEKDFQERRIVVIIVGDLFRRKIF